jgi:general nucleoside transport system permease protein
VAEKIVEWFVQLLNEIFSNLGEPSFWVAVLRIATPLIFGTLGILLCERAGVLNLGIEGIMAAGAFVGWYVCYLGFGLWVGIAAAALVGALLGWLHSLLTVRLALSQHVAGLGITLFASSLTYYSYRVLFPKVATPPTITPFQELHGFLDAIPIVGPILGSVTALTVLALLAMPVVHYLLYKTPFGLAIRTVGENPEAATSAGIDVYQVRTLAIMAGSALMAVGGAFLTMAAFNAFFFNMVNGRGWICVALVVFASWRPSKALLGALLFAAFDAMQLRLQQSPGNVLPYQLYLMVPYVLSIVALVLVARKAAYPAALMKPYLKGER